ncbi:hypothetical protein QUA44_13565 [Microcoleus sp. N9_A2]
MGDRLDLPKSLACGLIFEMEELLDTYYFFLGLELPYSWLPVTKLY